MREDDVLAGLKRILTEHETEPPLGAIVLVTWWKRSHPVISLKTEALNEDGLQWGPDLLGEEGVEIIQRHPNHQVVVLSEGAFPEVQPRELSPEERIRSTFSGVPVYRLTKQPPNSDFMFRTKSGKIL